MKLVLKKLDVEGIEQLENLVIEHIDSIEPGLRVVDSRLFLGHATIDVVALDASGSLVLVALGFHADEHLLLRVVEAYSWCLEYPESVRRHYPSVRVSEERPPRVMFVVDRVSDAFHRKVKQLNFGAVDCVEFRHIDVNGVPAMYFETAVRVRRGTISAAAPEIAAAPQIVKAAAPRQEVVGRAAERRGAAARAAAEGEASLRSQTPPFEASESKVVSVNGHGAEAPRVRFIEIPTEPARTEAPAAAALAAAPVAPPEVVAAAPVPVVELDIIEAAAPAPIAEPEIAPAPPAPAAPAAAEPAKIADDGERTRSISFAQAIKGQGTPELGGLQFPKDGALTRQWIEFLNQLSAK